MDLSVKSLRQTSPERISIELSNGEEIKATLALAAELRLYAGKALEERELETLRSSAALALCKNRGMELLSYRPMSAKELRDKLVQKGEAAENAEAAVDWLQSRGFLNDERYAGMVVRHYAGKGYGAGRIRQELQRRGISRELWEDALQEMPEQETPEQRTENLPEIRSAKHRKAARTRRAETDRRGVRCRPGRTDTPA